MPLFRRQRVTYLTFFFSDAQLGDGTEEVVSGLQGFDLLRESEGTEAEACGMDKAELISRLHHLIQTRYSGPHKVFIFSTFHYKIFHF